MFIFNKICFLKSAIRVLACISFRKEQFVMPYKSHIFEKYIDSCGNLIRSVFNSKILLEIKRN